MVFNRCLVLKEESDDGRTDVKCRNSKQPQYRSYDRCERFLQPAPALQNAQKVPPIFQNAVSAPPPPHTSSSMVGLSPFQTTTTSQQPAPQPGTKNTSTNNRWFWGTLKKLENWFVGNK